MSEENEKSNLLAEADPNSLEELFERVNAKLVAGMPEAISDEDIMPLVEKLRAQRKLFLTEQDRLGRAPGKRPKAKPTSVAEVIHEINLDGLE